MTLAIPIRGAPAAGAGFDYYLSPTGDDARGNGSLTSPWSLTAFQNGATINGVSNTPLPGSKRYGLLPGTYQYGYLNGVPTSLYSLAATGFNLPLGSSAVPTLVGSSDIHGNYSARTATIDFSLPGSAAVFTASIGPDTVNGGGIMTVTAMTSGTITPMLNFLSAGGLTPTWIDNQRTSTMPGGALGGTGTYGVSPWGDTQATQLMTAIMINPGGTAIFNVTGNGTLTEVGGITGTVPTTGWVTVAGINFKHFGYGAISYLNCTGFTSYDNDIGPGRCFTKSTNPACIHVKFCEGPGATYNNKIHDATTTVPTWFAVTNSICNGVTVAGPPVAGQMWTGGNYATPWPLASTDINEPTAWALDNGQNDKAGAGRGGIVSTSGSTAYTVGIQAGLNTTSPNPPAPVNGASYSGGVFSNIAGSANWPYPSATNYPLQLCDSNLIVMQTITITCTQGSPNFTVTGGPVTISVPRAIGVYNVAGIQISSTAPTRLALDPCGGFAPWGIRPYMQIPAGLTTNNVLVYNNTIYNVGGNELVKDFYYNNYHITYNYIEYGRKGIYPGVLFQGLGSGSQDGRIGAVDSGRTADFHHNIVWGGMEAQNSAANADSAGTLNLLNNTFVNCMFRGALNNGIANSWTHLVEPQTGIYNIHNNITWNGSNTHLVIGNGGTGTGWLGNMASPGFIDYNCYSSTAKFGFGPSPNTALTGTVFVGLSAWQTASGIAGLPTSPAFPGYDLHSTALTSSPFVGTAGDGVPVGALNTTTGVVSVPTAIASIQLNATTAANTASQTGGQCGALDGTTGPTGNTVGCNF